MDGKGRCGSFHGRGGGCRCIVGEALRQQEGEVVTKKELLTEVWHQAWGGSDKTVDVHLSWLRRKLGETAAEPRFITSVRGVGVRLAAPGE